MPRLALEADGIRTAARYLVSHPVASVATTDREMFGLIRRHRDALTRLFEQHLGWRLIVSDQGARLFKAGVEGRADRREMVGTSPPRPFTTKHYIALVLVFAVCEAHDRDWITVKDLHDRLGDLGASIDGFDWDPEGSKSDRYLLGAVLRRATQLGVLRLEDGDETRVVAGHRDADALYLVDRWVLSMLLSPQIAPSLTDGIDDLRRREARFDEMGRLDVKALLRRRVVRQLVEDPAVSFDGLAPDQIDHLRRTLRNRIEEPLDELFGLAVEARAEGLIAIDTDATMTDSVFPASSTVAHIALLVAGWLSGQVGERVPFSDIDHQIEVWAKGDYERFWSKGLSGGARTHGALRLLADHLLVVPDLDTATVVPLPPIARYRQPQETLHYRQENLL